MKEYKFNQVILKLRYIKDIKSLKEMLIIGLYLKYIEQ